MLTLTILQMPFGACPVLPLPTDDMSHLSPKT